MAIKNDHYNQILREYDNRQFANKHALDKRREEVFAAVPEIKALEDEMISLAAERVRLDSSPKSALLPKAAGERSLVTNPA